MRLNQRALCLLLVEVLKNNTKGGTSSEDNGDLLSIRSGVRAPPESPFLNHTFLKNFKSLIKKHKTYKASTKSVDCCSFLTKKGPQFVEYLLSRVDSLGLGGDNGDEQSNYR